MTKAILRLADCWISFYTDYNDMMMDGTVTPEYIDEPAYVDNGHYINVPPDMLEQHPGKLVCIVVYHTSL